jgi:hypothetical protein
MPVLGEELSDVVENFFLTLGAWQHLGNSNRQADKF